MWNVDCARRNNRGDRVFVDHLGNGIFEEDDVLVERLDLALKLYPIDEINGNRNMFSTQGIEKRILE